MKLTSFLILFLLAVGCNKSADTTFGDLESSTGNSEIPCGISSTSPSTSSLKVAATSGTKTVFNVETTTDSCEITFSINGTKFNTTSTNFIELDANNLSAGLNTVSVEAVNGSGSATYEWTVTKNEAPTCSRVLPSAYAINMTNSAPQNFTVSATKEEGETLEFDWLLDGASHASLSEDFPGLTGSMALLNANSLTNGVKTVSARVSDGYDEVTCSWSVNVGDACSVTAKTPDVESVKLAAAGASTNFGVTLSSSSCIVNWTLNGIARTGSGPSLNITSSDLPNNDNYLEAKVISTTGITSKNWQIVKNRPPVCAQTPSGSATTSIGTPLNLQANISDPNGDSVNWTWYFNGSTVSTTNPVNVSNLASSTSAVFTPTIGNIGYNAFNISLNDGYDAASCLWNVQVYPTCTISSKTPATDTLTVPNSPTTLNPFNVLASDASCNIAWSLNGNPVPGVNAINLMSGLLNGTNTLSVTVSNSTSSASHSWTINKNTPPVCSSQTPSALSQIIGVGATQAFTANITDPDAGQTLSYDWKLSGSTPSSVFFNISSFAGSTTGTWTTTSSQIGSHTLAVNVSDTFDSVQCSWPVEILRNCVASSATPSGSSLKVAALGSTSTSFGAVANDPSCAITWKLNGTTLNQDPTGQNFQNILSSSLSSSNTLEAVMTNAVSNTSRSWTINKNNPPLCASQNPSSASNSVNIGASLGLSLTASDADSDPLSYSWTYNNATSSTLITNPILIGYNSGATFTPILAQVGNNHTIKATFSDSYDSALCSWNITVVDPNSATIVAANPTTSSLSPVVILSTGSQTLSVTATGTGLTYEWQIDGNTVNGLTGSSANFNYSDMTIGVHTITVIARDTYGNSDTHDFYVKRNSAPNIGSYVPNVSGVSIYRVGLTQSFNFNISATDANSDTLSYQWQLDNGTSSYLNSDSNTANFIPSNTLSLLGNHTVKVIVSDGHESTTRSWPVVVNYFSDECNELYNSSPTGANGGRVCTLVGNPSMGHNQDITTDPTNLKSRPINLVELETGVYAVSDNYNNVVFVYNSNSSGNFVGLGKTILPMTMQVVLGNGSPGRNNEASNFTDAFQSVGSPPVSVSTFKLNDPRGVAWDDINRVLYVADRGNHRVLALNSNGKVLRVLGEPGAAASNVTASNTDNTLGNTHSCNQPTGATVSNGFLYVTCYNQNAIKRVNIADPSDSTNYGKTSVAVGRLSPIPFPTAGHGSTATHTNGAAAIPDGFPGGSFNTASPTSATAFTHYPFDINADDNGIIYWTELNAGANHGLRIRAYNSSASDVTIVAAGNTSLTSQALLLFRALDLNWQYAGAIALYTANNASMAVNVGLGTISNLLVSSQARMAVNGCHAVSVSLRNASNVSIAVSTSTTVTMSATSTNFYSDANCTSLLSSNQFSIPAGETHRTIFVKTTAIATPNTITAIATLVPSGTATGFTAPNVAAGATNCTTNCRVRSFASTRFKFDECLPVEFVMTNGSDVPGPRGSVTEFAIDHNNIGQFYSNASCTGSRIHRIQFSSTDINKIVYYKREIVIPAGMVSSVAGYDYNAAGTYNDHANGVKIGEIRFLNNLTGIGILKNTSTGYADAIAWGSTGSTVNYLNLTGNTANFGGRSFPGLRSEIIAGWPNSLSAPTALNGAGFNGDDQPSWGSSMNQVYGVQVAQDNSKIIFADYNNLRLRTTDLDSINYIRTISGAGRFRYRQNVTSSSAQAVTLYNPFKIDYSNSHIYFSEVSNHWIRRVNIYTGVVETVAGNGLSGSYTEGNDAIAEGMGTPRGFKVVPYPNSASPTNYVLFYAQATNCLVRAVNISGPTISNFYGVGNLLPGKVKTVAGDPTFPCAGWPSSGNTDGMNATSARLNDPQDIAVIGSDFYIMSYNDHCILKVDSDGKISRPQGTSCGFEVTSVDSNMDTMKTRRPRAFYPDMGKPGNYFFVDDYALATSSIRYINTLTGPVAFGNNVPLTVNARASTSAPFVVKTIYNQGGTPYVGGVTSWSASTTSNGDNDKVCWSSGALSDGTQGNHAIFCANRYSDDPGALISGPSTVSNIRGGGSIGREQEKIHRLNATYNTPYGIAFDEEGNLYISEYDNQVIRMIRRWW